MIHVSIIIYQICDITYKHPMKSIYMTIYFYILL